MNCCNGQGEALTDSEGKALRLIVHDIIQVELLSHFLYPGRNILFR